MNSHFCKVGRVTPSQYIEYNLQKLEEKYNRFMDDAYSLMHIDHSISDLLYYEASKLKQKISKLRKFL